MTRPAVAALRFPLIDAIKLLAAHAIVWHHFCAYGPVADAAAAAWPELAGLLYNKGRFAVQVFFVVAGYLAAQGLSQVQDWRATTFWQLAFKRYRRLAWPLAVALALAMAAAALTRGGLPDDMAPAAPSAAQLLAHGLLLQHVLGFEALSVGLWYVAVDFQLFVVLLTLFAAPACLTGRRGRARATTIVLTLALMLASLWCFNLDTGWDDWAPYFFGSYGLGACACWARRSPRRHEWLASLGLVVWLALLLDFRGRVLLAGLTAGLLVLFNRPRQVGLAPSRLQHWAHHGAQRAYALFLVHFPVLLLANWVVAWAGESLGAEAMMDPLATACAMLVAWLASCAAADVFYRRVECAAPRLPAWLFWPRRASQG
jgi:peptidoglycan/LPS O-acetylase OafA/YrhL